MRNWLTKNNGLILLKVLITCVFFILILNKVDFDSTIALLQKAEVLFIFLALFVVIMEVFIATIRWKVILNRLEINVPYITALRYLWIGVFFNQKVAKVLWISTTKSYWKFQ